MIKLISAVDPARKNKSRFLPGDILILRGQVEDINNDQIPIGNMTSITRTFPTSYWDIFEKRKDSSKYLNHDLNIFAG